MNDIRILIPWDELDERTKRDMGWTPVDGMENAKMYAYALTERNCTRPITTEDIRSCLRMPDEWTEDENARFASDIVAYEHEEIDSGELAQYAIDIALRAAPVEHKPCPICREKIICCHTFKDLSRHVLVCPLCGLATGEYYYEDDAWAAWDRRTTDEDGNL